mgnify:CR=1 FL=1
MKFTDAEVRERLLKLEGAFTVRSAHRELVAQGCRVSWHKVAQAVDLLVLWDQLQRVPGEAWTTYVVTGRPKAEALPTTPCSVVWRQGHPFVLDGEPGIPTPRFWVGVDDTLGLVRISEAEMAAYRPAVIYRDEGEWE